MGSHVLITRNFLKESLDSGLFGVTHRRINNLANIDKDDFIFLLETTSGIIVGPFEIKETIFQDDTPIWTDPEQYMNKIKFVSCGVTYKSDIKSLWSILFRREKPHIYTFTTFQRSFNSLLKNEGEELIKKMKEDGEIIEPKLKTSIDKRSVDLIRNNNNRFTSEARLEASLLIYKNEFIDILKHEKIIKTDENTFIINQLTLPGTNYNVDIGIFNNDRVIIIELKRDKVNDNDINQLMRYSEYWKLANKTVIPIILGARNSSSDKNLILIEYELDGDNSILELLIGENEYKIELS